MTKEEQSEYPLDWKKMMRLFDHCGIGVAKNFPVDDLIESVYSDTVF